MKMQNLIWISGTSLVLTILGCNNPAPVAVEPESPQAQWMILDPTQSQRSNIHYIRINNGPAPDPESLFDLHKTAEEEFTHTESQGASRMVRFEYKHGTIPDRYLLRDAALLHFPEVDQRLGNTSQWKLTNLQLIGLMKQPNGVAYVLPPRARLGLSNIATYPTRELTEQEQEALGHLRRGQNGVARLEANRIMMMGSLRITAACAKCHQQPEGTLMGAFVYQLDFDPTPYTPKPRVEKDQNIP